MAIKKKVESIEIRPLEIRKVKVRIVGDTPLIMHTWSEKAKQEMLDKQMKVTSTACREAKNPIEDFIRSMYWLTAMPTDFTQEGFDKAIADGARFGFPVTALKQSAISSAYRLGWVKNQMELRGTFFIDGGNEINGNSVLEIKSDPPVMREDMVKVGMGTADIRYRGEFRNWSSEFTITYIYKGKITLEQIVNVINAGGFCCGLGEWRPERDGQNGMFHIVAKDAA